MRTREEIEDTWDENVRSANWRGTLPVFLEILLDIREALQTLVVAASLNIPEEELVTKP